MGFQDEGFGSRVHGVGFRVWGSGLRIPGVGISDWGFRVPPTRRCPPSVASGVSRCEKVAGFRIWMPKVKMGISHVGGLRVGVPRSHIYE